jgi:DNA-binding XRE family transcriptional regulator
MIDFLNTAAPFVLGMAVGGIITALVLEKMLADIRKEVVKAQDLLNEALEVERDTIDQIEADNKKNERTRAELISMIEKDESRVIAMLRRECPCPQCTAARAEVN